MRECVYDSCIRASYDQVCIPIKQELMISANGSSRPDVAGGKVSPGMGI